MLNTEIRVLGIGHAQIFPTKMKRINREGDEIPLYLFEKSIRTII